MAGGMSLVAALAGSWIGGSFALSGTDSQIVASSEQSQSEFVREQRIGAYTTFLESVNELESLEEAMFDDIDRFALERVTVEAAGQRIKEVESHIDTMSKDENLITIVGSEQVRTAVRDIIGSHQALGFRARELMMTELVNLRSANPHSESAAGQSRESTATERMDVENSYRIFLEQIRQELKIPS